MAKRICGAGLLVCALAQGAQARNGAAVDSGGSLSLDRELGSNAYSTAQDQNDMRVYWKQGLRLETLDKRVKFRFGGRFHNDWLWQTADDGVGELGSAFDFEDGTEFRRARIEFSGEFDSLIDWYAAYDFADGGTAVFRDAYLGYRPDGYRVRVGQFKQPFSLEWQTTSNGITFMERGALNQIIVNRGVGIMIQNDSKAESMTWGLALVREADEQGLDAVDGEYTVTGRVTGAPIFENDGERVVHVGGAASLRGREDFSARLRFDEGLAPVTIDSGNIPVDDALLLGLEFAWVEGPWSFQAEAISEQLSARSGPDPEIFSWYALISRFLTQGDRRPYNRSSGAFGKVTPQRSLGVEGGKGALELALRFDATEFDDVAAFAGMDDGQKALTLGLNWYQNYHVRTMFNLLAGEQDDLDGRYLGLGIRFQMFF